MASTQQRQEKKWHHFAFHASVWKWFRFCKVHYKQTIVSTQRWGRRKKNHAGGSCYLLPNTNQRSVVQDWSKFPPNLGYIICIIVYLNFYCERFMCAFSGEIIACTICFKLWSSNGTWSSQQFPHFMKDQDKHQRNTE